jgi:cytochrome P450
MLSRETLAETEWNGATVPAGTQALIVNTFAHRNRDRIPYADRFAPEEWTEGDAADEPAFNHFSRGPQGCPGQRLSLHAGNVVVTELLQRHSLKLRSPKLDPDKPLPHMLDYFGIKLELGPH